MTSYLFIESRDPYDSADVAHLLEIVHGVRANKSETTLFLVQNGVLAARHGALHGERLRTLAQAGVSVLADAFSLRERAIERAVDGVKSAEIDELVRLLLAPGTNAGAELGLLLRGNAVNYLARGQDASGLTFGDKPLAHPLQPDKELEALLAAGVAVYAVEEDLRERALAADRLIGGVEKIHRQNIARLFDRYDRVWHW